ncbi:MAG: DUF1361 domain-containing protein [Candidatus Levyibacteriota bacterium]
MSIFVENALWMSFNIALALFAVLAGWIAMNSRQIIFKIIFGLLWLIFLPNTIYILTDIIHLIKQINLVSNFEVFLLIIQYLLFLTIGALTFIYGVYPLEGFLSYYIHKRLLRRTLIIILIFLISFGVILGRMHRLNSWDIIFNFQKLTADIFTTLTSLELIVLIILFGIIGNLIYFLLREKVFSFTNNFIKVKISK